jgi:imidazolonepropionase-like amidohydrolase
MLRILTLFAILCFAYSQQTLIYSGKLIDGNSDKVLTHKTIVILDKKIVRIDDGFTKASATDKVIDLKDKTVLPGLMDLHTHLASEYSKNYQLKEFTFNEADYAYTSVGFAKKTLMAGFTTVRELGGPISTPLRNAIAKGLIVGPRIFSAGTALATTGGHADPTNGWATKIMGNPEAQDGIVNGIESARKAVRQNYKNGADLIKITATGGVLSVAKNGQNPQFSMEELKAIVTTANDYGMHVAAHAHGDEGMQRAIIAGVRSIEHGTLMLAETMKLMKKHGTYLVPTVSAGKWVEEKAEIDGFFPELVRPKARAIGPMIQTTLGKAYKAGVKIAFGTDSGVSPHGENGKEFKFMKDAGLPAMYVIKTATKFAAELLGVEETLGTISNGKIADIIAVNENPIDDISTMENVVFVMKEGRVYKNN